MLATKQGLLASPEARILEIVAEWLDDVKGKERARLGKMLARELSPDAKVRRLRTPDAMARDAQAWRLVIAYMAKG